MLFERADWTLFGSLNTLGQKAGVHVSALPRLVVKELVDNALDVGAAVRFGELDGGFYVEDDGPGIPGTDEEIATLFSIKRPLLSSKLLRLPTRGALGNGLRVVAGAVLSSSGTLTVRTGRRSLQLCPQDDGTTRAEPSGRWKNNGTRIELTFGPALTQGADLFLWAETAIALAGCGTWYRGRSSPWWYDEEAFWELLRAAGSHTVRAVVARLERCHGNAARLAARFAGRAGSSLTRGEAAGLLADLRLRSERVKPIRLGAVGRLDNWVGYARDTGIYKVKAARGELHAEVPFVVEAWARPADGPAVTVCVNRTPVTAETELRRELKNRSAYALFGCGLGHQFQVGRSRDLEFLVNVQTPYMPITSDGKEPDLRNIIDPFLDAMAKAARVARRVVPATNGQARTKKGVILDALEAAAAQASGDGRWRFSQRQLFYKVRPHYLKVFAEEPSWDTFCNVVTEYEAAVGRDIPGMYRDARGTLYHPHTREEISLGTLSVEQYRRPVWTFNKILYCEKEGFYPILKDAAWPERHDCALLTSKGFSTRAVRDVLDFLGETTEPLTFYCIHDADGPGTMIYQSLQEATKARPARSVHIVNLGLEPDEALAMGLDVEPVHREGGKAVPVANYVSREWRAWLQKNRVELNAMSTPQFLEWLDRKFAEAPGKVVPPLAILSECLTQEFERTVREQVRADVLREGRFEDRTAVAVSAAQPAVEAALSALPDEVAQAVTEEPAVSWAVPVRRRAERLATCRGTTNHGRRLTARCFQRRPHPSAIGRPRIAVGAAPPGGPGGARRP